MKRWQKMVLIVGGGVLVLVLMMVGRGATSEQTPTSEKVNLTGDLIVSNVFVEEVEVLAVEGNEEVMVAIRGRLGDPCALVGEIRQRREEERIILELSSIKPVDGVCEEQERVFEEVVELDVGGLPRGEYMVVAGGVETELSLRSERETASESARID